MSIKKAKSKRAIDLLEKSVGKKLTLGMFMLAIRQGDELTQSEFSQMLGISKQYLCDIEHGRRFVSAKTAKEFAQKLGYAPEQFVRLCLQDMMDRDELNFVVSIKAA